MEFRSRGKEPSGCGFNSEQESKYTTPYPPPFKWCKFTKSTTTHPTNPSPITSSEESNSFPFFRRRVSLSLAKHKEKGKRSTMATTKKAFCTWGISMEWEEGDVQGDQVPPKHLQGEGGHHLETSLQHLAGGRWYFLQPTECRKCKHWNKVGAMWTRKLVEFSSPFSSDIFFKCFFGSGLRKATMVMGSLSTGHRLKTFNWPGLMFYHLAKYQGAWSRHHGGLGHARSPQLGGEIHFDAGER